DHARRLVCGIMSELDIAYDFGAGHPLLGRRVPDLDLVGDDGPMQLYALLRDAKPVLLNLGPPASLDSAAWGGRVRLVEARYEGRWELPVVGVVTAPGAVLIRPDGHVAWVGDRTAAGLAEALTRWFGPPA
ncbi:MAG: hypothetical protein J0I48_01110, partial [Devosia sp.]|nr:hypothetical protein [Devosia sp.]